MKLSKYIFAAMVAVAAFASCHKEMPGPQVEPIATKEITLTVSSPQTKVVMDNATGNMLWGENESIAVVFHNGWGSYIYKFDQISEGGSYSATFRGRVDESFAERSADEVFYPYVEGYDINAYRSYGVSTSQDNLVLNADGQYELGRIPLHWSKETMGDGIVLQSDRSAIVRLAKEDVTYYGDGLVNVAFYCENSRVQNYTVRVALEGDNLKDDLVFLVDVPEIERVRRVVKPAFILNESDGSGLKRSSFHTGWSESLKAPKTIVPGKRYNIKPYVYFHNLNAPSDKAYVIVDNEKLKDVWRSPKVHNVEWGECFDAMPGYVPGNDWEEGKGYAMEYDRQKIAISVNNKTRTLWTSEKLTDCDGGVVYYYEKTDYALNWDSPDGMTGILDGQECVVVSGTITGNVVYKMAIAKKDIGAASEISDGTRMTWYDAIKNYNNPNGWRLPTLNEIAALKYKKGEIFEHYLKLDFGESSSLCFPLSGYYDKSFGHVYNYGDAIYCWSSEFDEFSKESLLTDNNAVIGAEILTSNKNIGELYASSEYIFRESAKEENRLSVRQVHSLPITANTPVGSIGIIDGKEGMVVNLKDANGQIRKVIITTRNEGANSYDTRFSGDNNAYSQSKDFYLNCFGSYLSYSEALAKCTNGWRIPSVEEWQAFFDCYPYDNSQTYRVRYAQFVCRDNDTYRATDKKCSIFKIGDGGSLLYFHTAGWQEAIQAQGILGHYWTSTEGSTTGKHRLVRFSGSDTYLDPALADSDSYHYPVRLIHDMPQ